MPEKIFIEINRTCTKDCYYCYNSKRVKSPTYPDTNKIIDAVLRLSNKRRDIGLVFSGGEPVLNLMDIIKIISVLNPLYPRLQTTLITNIDTLSSDFVKFLQMVNPYLVLSFNKNTKTLIKEILKLINKDHILIRFTLTPENIGYISDEIKQIISAKILCGISPAYGIAWGTGDLKRLTTIYFELAARHYCNYIVDFIKVPKKGFCKSLDTPNAIDINGNIYPCHRAIYFDKLNINESKFISECNDCPAGRFCTPCVYKNIPGEGCKIRVAIAPAYELLLKKRRKAMKKKVKITHKGRTYAIPERVLKRYLEAKGNSKKSRTNIRNFYELGESDCY